MALTIKNKKITTHEGEDVSDRLVEFLFEEVISEECEFLLEDVFSWIQTNPVLLQVYRREFVVALVAEAQKGPSQAAIEHKWRRNAAWINEDLDYLELAEYVEYNTRTKEVESGGNGFLQLSAASMPLMEDSEYLGKKGDVVTFSVSVTPIRDLLLLPVKIKTSVLVTEADTATRNWHKILLEVTKPRVTLGRLIEGLLWEMSFHGGPDSQKEFAASLDTAMEELSEAREAQDSSTDDKDSRATGTSADDMDLFYELGADDFDLLFECAPEVHAWVKNKVIGGLRLMDDDQIVDPIELVKTVRVQAAYPPYSTEVTPSYDSVDWSGVHEAYPGFEAALLSCQLKAAFAQRPVTAFELRVQLADQYKTR